VTAPVKAAAWLTIGVLGGLALAAGFIVGVVIAAVGDGR
jgi:hypothetical protein